MTGPRKFLPRFSTHAMTICAAIIAFKAGHGVPSTTLFWYGAMGWGVFGLIVQSEWPREKDDSFVSIEDANRHEPKAKGLVHSAIDGFFVTSILAALPAGVVCWLMGN